jgi:hypothetical protein
VEILISFVAQITIEIAQNATHLNQGKSILISGNNFTFFIDAKT